MEVVSLSALPVASVLWQSSPGSTVLTVICKATFSLEPGESPLAEEQEPVSDHDRSATKAGAGVLLVGPGYPHGDRVGRAPVAHIVVGTIDSRLEIQGEARFNEELGPLSALRADERLLLENLHVEHPRLLTRLPGIRPFAFLDRLGAPQRFAFEADTLWIDTARSICSLTFRVAIPLRSAEEQGAVLVTLAQAGQEPTWADIPTRRLPMLSEDLATGDEIEGPIDDVEGPLDDTNAGYPEVEGHESLPTQRPPALTIPFDLASGDFQMPGLPFASRSPTPAPPPSDALGMPPSGGLPFRASPSGVVIPSPPVSSPSAAFPSPPISSPSGAFPSPPVSSSPAAFPSPPISLPSSPAMPLRVPPPPRSEPVRFAHPSTAPPPPPSPVRAPPPSAMPSPPALPSSVGRPPPMVAPAPPLSVPSPPGGSAMATSGVFFASGTAAAVSEPWFARRADSAPTPQASTPLPTSHGSSQRIEPEGAIQLVFHEADSMPRIRRTPRWRSILLDLEKHPPDPDLEDPAFAKDPADVEDRREIFEILARGTPAIAAEINEALVAAVRDDGKLVPPLLLVGGELQLPFDEIETLRATVTTVTPLAGNDENLRASIDVARQFLAIPGLATAPAVAEGLTKRIRDAWNQGKRMVEPGYLDAQTERVLTEQRHYQRRTVFGGPHLRALLHAGGPTPIPAYLPESAAKVLPLHPRFKVRLVAEVHLQIDPYETHQAALRGVALARVSPLPKR